MMKLRAKDLFSSFQHVCSNNVIREIENVHSWKNASKEEQGGFDSHMTGTNK
jgi:hypothetical protein